MNSDTVGPTNRPWRTILRVIAITTLVASILMINAGIVAAGRGGGKGGGTLTGSATVTVAPSPVAVGAYYVVSGSGYATNAQLNVKFITSSSTAVVVAYSDGAGSFSLWQRSWQAGTVKVEVWQYGGKGWTFMATTTFTVV